MAYQINKTDGSIVATVADGQIDNISTDITLIGKNYSGFGESLNENFIKILENFSSIAQPTQPVRGQIWYDASEAKLKVYSGTAFVPVSSATIAGTQPETLGVGDLWFNDSDKQLYFFDGTNTILLGPDYSDSQGVSGLRVTSILDTLNQTRVITSLFNNGVLLGIFSKDTFTPKNNIEGYEGSIIPGFNASTLSGIKFDVTTTNSEKLNNVDASLYVRSDTANSLQNALQIESDLGLQFGAGGQGVIQVSNGNVRMSNQATGKQIIFDVRSDATTQEEAISINPETRTIKLYDGQPTSTVEIDGSAEIGGDLTIKGRLTINDGDIAVIRETELEIEDKYIVLAQTGDSASNSNTIADGGGIVLKGTTDHVLMWSDLGLPGTPEYPALAAQSWTSSENFNVASGKVFMIDGIPVLTGNSLGAGITSIPGVTAFGTQNVINVGPGVPPTAQLRIENTRLSTLSGALDLELEPHTGGNVALVGAPKITGVADPTTAQDASTKEYVDNTIETRTIHFSMDLSDGKPNSYIATNVLANLAPPSEYRDGTNARILCTLLSNSTTSLDINPLVNQSTATFNTPSGTAAAVTNVSVSQATVDAPSVTTTRIIKVFQLLAGVWTHVSDTVLP
jgi:hypothetical protein|tara:strand:- start:22408 stop:24279 length:1872 start_codon:yes stop_codon:yes gene_type:complete